MPWPRRFLRSFQDPFISVLLCLGPVSALITAWGTACVILALVSVSCLLRTTQEHRADRSSAALRELVAITATVVRRASDDSPPREREVPVADLVVADARDGAVSGTVDTDGPSAAGALDPETYEGVATLPFDPVRRVATAVVRRPGRLGVHPGHQERRRGRARPVCLGRGRTGPAARPGGTEGRVRAAPAGRGPGRPGVPGGRVHPWGRPTPLRAPSPGRRARRPGGVWGRLGASRGARSADHTR
ncbi:hypothetical protein [Streptomyces globisporus]|uniref:hypothetical protein n=1 Tax=Streptomyces globisporus TaxID=1908 RepID=UPI00367DA819